MAKKQTRRSISVSRTTYERLKAFCETNGVSMSQFVENRVGDFLGEAATPEGLATEPAVVAQSARPIPPRPVPPRPAPPRPVITSAAARYAVDPPPPIIKRAEQPTPKAPAMPKAEQIFTF